MKLKMKSAVITAVLVPAAVTAIAALLVLAGCKNPAKGAEIKTVRLTLTGDLNVTVKTEFITVEKGTKWSAVKKEADKAVGFAQNSTLEVWKFTSSKGEAVTDNYAFTEDKVIYALSKKEEITLTFTGGSEVKIKTPKLTFPKGTKWGEIAVKANEAVKIAPVTALTYWKFDGADGEKVGANYIFSESKTLFAVTEKNIFRTDGNGTVKGLTFKSEDAPAHLVIPTKIGRETITKISSSDYVHGSFCNALKIEQVTLPVTLIEIGWKGFPDCKNLKSVNFSECVNLSKIDGNSFENTALTQVELPVSLKEIYTNAFDGCNSLTSLTVDEANPYLCAEENILYSKDKTVLYCAAPTITALNLPESLEVIRPLVFARFKGLTGGLDFSRCPNLTSIGYMAFIGCTGLNGDLNFSGCTNLTEIGDNAFDGCTGLTGVLDFSGFTNLISIGYEAFENCKGLTGSLNFSDCTNLKVIVDGAFSGCTGLTGGLDFSSCVNLEAIGEKAFSQCRKLDGGLNFSGCTSLTEIGDGAFAHREYLTGNLDFSSCTNLKVIGHRAFYNCKGLTGLNFSGCINLTAIGAEAFAKCQGLTGGLDFSSCGNLTVIGISAFSMHDSLTGHLNLSGCTKLKAIGRNAFKRCKLESADLSGCISLTEIEEGIFYQCSKLKTVDLSDCISLTKISNYPFRECTELVSVIFPPSLTEIGDGAFCLCTALEEADLSSTNLKKIGAFAFAGCSNAAVTLPATISDISRNYFSFGGGEYALCKKVRIPATPAEAYQRIRRLVIDSGYSGIIETY